MEALLPGAQHREAGASWLWAVEKRWWKCPGKALMEGTSGEVLEKSALVRRRSGKLIQ